MSKAGAAAKIHSASTVDPAHANRHRTLVMASAILATATALIFAGYGISHRLPVLWALALDMALVALAAWICVSACRLCRQSSIAEESQHSQVPADLSRMRAFRWGADPVNVESTEHPAGCWDAYHVRKLHYVFWALIPTFLVVLLAARGLVTTRIDPTVETSPGAATALAVVCLAVSCIWLILARTYAALTDDELPERASLSVAFRDLQWASLLAAAALLSSLAWAASVPWTGRFLFAWVLAVGIEQLVAIDCLVYDKIHEERQRFLDYVYYCQNPEDSLEAYAYRALMERTCRATLREVLTANRAQFANQLEDALREYAESNRLGIEVVDVALMELDPPVEAAADYLDVISAGIDAERVRIEALGEQAVSIEDAQRQSAAQIASSQVEAARRTGQALGESSQFLAIGQAFAVAPESLRLRLWFEALEEILVKKRFVLVDQSVATGSGGILFDQRDRAEAEEEEDPVPLLRDTGFPGPNRWTKEVETNDAND